MTSPDPDAATDVTVDAEDLAALKDTLSKAQDQLSSLVSDADEGGPEAD